MMDGYQMHAVLPVANLERAKSWWADTLGMKPTEEDPGGAWYEAPGCRFVLSPSPYAGTAKNTCAEWSVDDIDAVMTELRGRGVTFEEYDMPGFKTENGVATLGPFKGSWFKDSEGNLLAITQKAG
jgi:catechol 2,3-dioxygenase-like lactoylglutathione lyase family enzyme